MKTSALLIIDVQNRLFNLKNKVHKSNELLQKIKTLEKYAHERNMMVVYIQHENQTTIKFDSEPWKLHKELSPNENDIRIRKKENNAFFETDLNTMLKENSITKLFICGLLSNLCVYNTCLGALEFKYETILISDGHSNVSKNPEEKKSQINKKLEKVGVKCITTNDFICNSK